MVCKLAHEDTAVVCGGLESTPSHDADLMKKASVPFPTSGPSSLSQALGVQLSLASFLGGTADQCPKTQRWGQGYGIAKAMGERRVSDQGDPLGIEGVTSTESPFSPWEWARRDAGYWKVPHGFQSSQASWYTHI